MANCLCRKNHMCRKDLAQVYAQDRERQGGGVLTRAVGPKPVNRHASTAERVRAPRPPRPRARADTARARAADADQLTPIRRADTEVRAAGALTGARYGVCAECARQRNSLDCKPAHRHCLHYLSIRVDYRVAQWCGPSRAAAAERGGANHGTALAMGIRRIERDPCDAPKVRIRSLRHGPTARRSGPQHNRTSSSPTSSVEHDRFIRARRRESQDCEPFGTWRTRHRPKFCPCPEICSESPSSSAFCACPPAQRHASWSQR